MIRLSMISNNTAYVCVCNADTTRRDKTRQRIAAEDAGAHGVHILIIVLNKNFTARKTLS